MSYHPIKPDFMMSDEVEARVPYSRAHLYRLEDQGEFPKRKRIGANRVAWVRAEIERWLADRLEGQA
ncbi:MAG: AlpA family phage regulatory protein [Rhodobacteraceae bacterium]|jgi:prophage regulatory protein|nr:AlpA family phage regulatory protein [Paracoccaceae bacterium]